MSTTQKNNPRKTPRTQADVDRAWRKRIDDGVSAACAIILTVLVDKFGGADHMADIWRKINKLSAEVKERRVSIGDLRYVLRQEYDIEV